MQEGTIYKQALYLRFLFLSKAAIQSVAIANNVKITKDGNSGTVDVVGVAPSAITTVWLL